MMTTFRLFVAFVSDDHQGRFFTAGGGDEHLEDMFVVVNDLSY